MIYIRYKLGRAGWANGSIGNGKESTDFLVSYLNDSLKELAESAIDIASSKQKSVVFMDEPGETELVITNVDNKKIVYEVKWYDDWSSWGIIRSKDEGKTVLTGEVSIADYIVQVKNVLSRILNEFGMEKYKELWVNHDFPLAEYKKLKALVEEIKRDKG